MPSNAAAAGAGSLSRSLRLSINQYLNALPLTWALSRGVTSETPELRENVPSGNAEDLASGWADAALLPSIESQRIPGLVFADGLAIASPGPVRSVLLLTRDDPARLRRVAVTPASRTSVVLLRILLRRRFGVTCPLEPFSDLGAALQGEEGVLVIGDPALAGSFPGWQRHDLAELWVKLSGGLPFVFAVWAVQAGPQAARAAALVREAAETGLARLGQIAEEAAPKVGMPRADIEAYLGGNLCYRLGEREKRSLAAFLRLAAEEGALPDVRDLTWI